MSKINITINELEKKALEIRVNLLKLSTIQNIHIGGDLSITDMMTALWQYKMNYDVNNPDWEERDRFILSKGHASAVTALNQAAVGCFSKEEVLQEYAVDEGRFSMHPCKLINPYVEVSTGSLGHGMPIACGLAMGLKLKNNHTSRVYTIMGDGEQSEGSIWEAALNAVQYKLGNLVAIIDNNEIEGDGFIKDLTALGDIGQKYKAFGWNVIEIDGHEMEKIKNTLDELPPVDSDIPTVIVCHTVKGKGVLYMERQVRWHTGKLTETEAEKAIEVLEKEYNRKWK